MVYLGELDRAFKRSVAAQDVRRSRLVETGDIPAFRTAQARY
jgi:hypothetical protein